MTYKEIYDKVPDDIKVDIDGNDMYWNGRYTHGSICSEGTDIWFYEYDIPSSYIQDCPLMKLISFIDGKKDFTDFNGRLGEQETHSVDVDNYYYFLVGDMEMRNELIRIHKIADRYNINEWWW